LSIPQYHRSILIFLLFALPPHPSSTLFPYTTLFRSQIETMRALAIMDSSETPQKIQVPCRNLRCKEMYYQGQPEDDCASGIYWRSEEHTSELQSPYDLVCRLLLEKKNNKTRAPSATR